MEAWGTLPLAVAEFAPVVGYDRPGIGGSDFDGLIPTMDRVTRHLEELLSVLDVPPPYVLVGHSWGGPLIRHYADKHPQDVVGMVYIDPTDPTAEGSAAGIPYPSVLDDLGYNESEQRALLADIETFMDGKYAKASPEIQAQMDAIREFKRTPLDQRDLSASPRVPTFVVLGTRYKPQPGWPSVFDERFLRATLRERIGRFTEWVLDLQKPLHWALVDFQSCFSSRDSMHMRPATGELSVRVNQLDEII